MEYLKAHLIELKKAIDEGCRVLAYCTWSFTDLLSCSTVIKTVWFVFVDREETKSRVL
ncbi:family 1 glycosylhydrolase [Dubosiella newyorkensis]|uniref:family 1 glycosylhydrolase n=1 Tax=Dubosiella newyorkensis TaxID=1862672 RepID=UPI003F668475